MRVNDSNTPNLNGASSAATGKAAELEAANRAQTKPGVGATGPESDRVSLSNLSGTLRAALGESPERAAKLEKLSAQVASGEYKVDSATLSQDIVNDELGSGSAGTSTPGK